ncbi:hypothetical protein AMES_8352 [Amycolatopsis mediterranei S699]|uniref:Uncharacterized protein n=2 Tax=Amycolatopsis mediterranei TaxID=33910 RepID=A0A0H3DIZ7_AMYMU|nr:hypothetical protein [Amycolatopsis mediterranei]ADJ50177.1 hypothetical protein AMED_8481 [Amycolatopsis mediterranei U32]AEK47174.1 hypothetical protein RAM_43535 [Amycolatopsis mediterranei S699]AFO81885.1 hypothetical protein AMES_8352 [Amycolatopsis mediterranei S699]AGT89014.1 hypothetical protein B737_8353 [Amycolatopsis mediterranei RB]KDO07574.1 hypothetical protein DV26_25120 [Amycolatopsis mediterranei]
MNKKLVGSAVVGAAVLAVVVALLLGGGDGAPKAAPPPPSLVPASTPPPTPQAEENYDFPAEAGSESGGFSVTIPVPATWAATHDKDRASYRHGDLLLETDRVHLEQEDPVSGLRAVAKAAGHGGTVTEHAPIFDYDAAEWDYTYPRDGSPRRVSVVGLGVGDTLITIRFEAPPAEFESNRGVLDAALQVGGAG